MRGYHDASYGDGFADVYDDWYLGISDVDTTTAVLFELAEGGRVLELGVGTGRLAVPLAARGLEVHGIDSSQAMLDVLRSKAAGGSVRVHVGDMVTQLPAGQFSLVFVAYNTFFNLLDEQRQQRCMSAVADRLTDGGAFVVEAFVPDPNHDPTSGVEVKSVTADRVVLSVSTSDPDAQRAEGQYIDITEAGGVRLRPWAIRWATPAQLDEMAGAAGLVREERWAAFDRSEFVTDSERHVTVYRKGSVSNRSSVHT